MKKESLFVMLASLMLLLSANVSAASIVNEEDSSSCPKQQKVYLAVEDMPDYPGGTQALMKFLNNNVRYPADAQKKKIQGRVVVCFILTKTGNIEDVKIAKSVYPSLDAEAIRVVKLMPKWKPGKQNGKTVNVKYTLPIAFRLQ
jgi:protein TonB